MARYRRQVPQPAVSCAARLLTRRSREAIFPVDEPAADLLFGGLPLRRWQTDACEALGLPIVDVHDDDPLPPGTVVAFAADALFNSAALRGLRDAASTPGASTTTRLGLDPHAPLGFVHRDLQPASSTTASFLLPIWAGPSSGLTRAELETSTTWVLPATGHRRIDARPYGAAHPAQPPALQASPHEVWIPDDALLAGWPTTWLQVLELSLAALWTRLRMPQSSTRLPRDRRPRIHPTCIVENSILGAGVRLEAHVSVRNSVIGDDVLVADHTVIEGSVIGDGCRTLVDTHLRRVVAMGGSTLSNLDMQDVLCGREIFLTTGVAYFHDGPGRNVVVDGVDSGRAMLAGAIGRRAVLGSRALFRAGTALPAGALVVAKPEEALSRVDERGLARAHMTMTTA